MLKIDSKTKQISINRGDAGVISVSAKDKDGLKYTFKTGDIVRFKVFKPRDCGCVEIQKDAEAIEGNIYVDVKLTKEDTKIGDLINKPADYWYEVELNPDTNPQTIIGFDEKGEKKFKLYPEGGDRE